MGVRLSRVMRLAVAAATLAAASSAAIPAAGAGESFIVRGPGAAHAVHAVGGEVDVELPLVNGVAASLDDREVRELRGDGYAVTEDVPLELSSATFDTSVGAHLASVNLGDDWSPNAGAGVGVALVDTGVSEVPGLAGKVTHGPDFSGEGDGADRYGHGTFMAGLIAGDDTGVAPGARVVSVKVAGADGSTTMSKVLAAMGWVVTHREEHGIRVLNLSFGVVSRTPAVADPLAGASEAAWASGITVVAAAGNNAGEVTSPGSDPWVVTVGATDTNGTATTADDTVPSWSGSATVNRVAKPELVAPGVSVVSVRVPGSTIDEANPQARVGEAYFRGSGTSMATALTAGAAAVLTGRHAVATPDEVKGALVSAGDPLSGTTAVALDLKGADEAEPQPSWWQSHGVGWNGLGKGLTAMPWSGSSWSGLRWNGLRWNDEDFAGLRWNGLRWNVEEWADLRWNGLRWNGLRWNDEEWAGLRWNGLRWNEQEWAGLRWNGLRWNSEVWFGLRWNAASWGELPTP